MHFAFIFLEYITITFSRLQYLSENGVRRTPPRKIPPLSNSPTVNSPEENSPEENYPVENCPVSFPHIIFAKKMFLHLKIWFFIYEGDQHKYLQSIVFIINKIDFLSDTFNIDKMYSNKDLDLI